MIFVVSPDEQFIEAVQHFLNEYIPVRPIHSLTFIDNYCNWKKVNYIDTQISHINDQVRTKIYHDQEMQPRSLPFMSDYLPMVYSTLIQTYLIHAALICCKASDFQDEHRGI
ncbi:unnamed protein product [Rotaria sordida]|uniref:Uncharacterized protein n=1 Tax=Rotaria sordida TaxID=392033 RepID=A0A814W057_9BILA|nr:unnamed protein product [Rotaria sordida]CAF1464124.1 unnamed protein product [Rotaria sordida]